METVTPVEAVEQRFIASVEDFQDPSQEWRRLFSELLGTFFLVLVAAGGGMMGQAFPDTISRTAAVVAPGLMVMAIILFMGKVSGAHLNPAVSIAFALRGDFPWWRVPGYIVVQLGGAALAPGSSSGRSTSRPPTARTTRRPGTRDGDAFWMETGPHLRARQRDPRHASGAQNIGVIGALGVGGYIALAGLWGSPISGASMNPAARSARISSARDFHAYWVYVAGPARRRGRRGGLRVRAARPGGGRAGSAAAQGDLFTEAKQPDKA